MKTRIYKNRFGKTSLEEKANQRPNPEYLKDCFFPECLKGLKALYTMSYVEVVEREELLKNVRTEDDWIGMINEKIYVQTLAKNRRTAFGEASRPYNGAIIMNKYIELYRPSFYNKYRLLFE